MFLNNENTTLQEKESKALNKKVLFNPNGDDTMESRDIIGGNITNLIDLTSVKYTWSKNLYHLMMSNFWIPEKIDLTKDASEYLTLTTDQQEVFDNIISSLTFLDSLQTNSLPKLSDYITAPEISVILGIQTFQEIIHSQSYSYIVNSIIPKEKLQDFFHTWKQNDVLYKRNNFLLKYLHLFAENPTTENFVRACVITYILEGVSFYTGFNIFYSITFTLNKLFGVTDMIRYINRDELSHVFAFKNLINDLEDIYKLEKAEIISLMKEAVENETELMKVILKSSTYFGVDSEISRKYIEYVANLRLKDIGIDPIFETTEDPFAWLTISGLSQETLVKSNFFEANVTSYNMSSSVSGWGF